MLYRILLFSVKPQHESAVGGKIFFYLDLFKSLVEFDTLWLLVSFSFFGHQAFGSLAPQSGIKPTAPCIGRQSLNCWTAREVLITVLLAEVHAFFVSPQLFPNVLFLPQEPHMTFYPHVSLDSSGLSQFLSLFFFFLIKKFILNRRIIAV